MTQEDKELLLKYLCMALPYGVICNDNCHGSGRVTNIDITPDDIEQKNGKVVVYYFDFDECGELKNCKPYLRPMSSMTKKEMEKYNGEFEKDRQDILKVGEEFEEAYKNKEYESVWQHPVVPMYRHIIWLLKNHFDFIGLIPKGLAIEVIDKNNPYKE